MQVDTSLDKAPAAAVTRHSGEHLRFSFCELDDGGKWALANASRADLPRLLKRLRAIESFTVKDAVATHTLSAISMDKCPNKSAAARLANQYDGLDSIHEIRIEKSQDARLFGRLQGRFFNIIWWDPKHEVWPTDQRRR